MSSSNSDLSASPYYDKNIEEKIDSVMANMTIEEKVGQMTQITLDVICKGNFFDANKEQELDDSLLHKAIVTYKVGSVLNTGQNTMPRDKWIGIIDRIQAKVKETKMQIPVLYGVDAIHGANYSVGSTLFPQELATAATFNPQYAHDCGEVTAYELRACNIPWNFSPVLDLGRQPLWSRFFETYGEDPYLVTKMGEAIVQGYQGKPEMNKIDDRHVVACLKHFVGYSNSKTGKDRTPIQMSERELREYYLVPFQQAIKKGAMSVMINSTEINGTPVHANSHILTDILKNEMEFDGFAVTDWEDIVYLKSIHRVAKDEREATKIAINAGIDMSMVPMKLDFADHLVDLVKTKEVSEERINDAVRRILRVKFRVGLFDNKLFDAKKFDKYGSQEFAQKAYNAAKESITLLKNQNAVLPIAKDKKVFFTGVGANSLNALNGAWTHTWQGVESRFNTKGKETIYEAASRMIGKNATFSSGTSYDTVINIEESVQKAKLSDVIVVCLGEMPATEKVGDIKDLNLPRAQKDLVIALSKLNKPMIAVLLHSRPRIISDIEPLFDGIFDAYWPGDEGGRAIAETIFGDNNPSGKLPFTYPRYSNDLVLYDHKRSEKNDKNFGANAFNPQWEFGFGLSYSKIEYSNLTVNDTLFTDSVLVEVTVKNNSDIDAKESVLLFSEDLVATITPCVNRLRAFDKISLKANEQKIVKFTIKKEDLSYMENDYNWVTGEGDFLIKVKDMQQKVVYKNMK